MKCLLPLWFVSNISITVYSAISFSTTSNFPASFNPRTFHVPILLIVFHIISMSCQVSCHHMASCIFHTLEVSTWVAASVNRVTWHNIHFRVIHRYRLLWGIQKRSPSTYETRPPFNPLAWLFYFIFVQNLFVLFKPGSFFNNKNNTSIFVILCVQRQFNLIITYLSLIWFVIIYYVEITDIVYCFWTVTNKFYQ